MADTAVAITAGTGTNIDTRTESTNSNHRQVIVIGDPSTNAGVAPVDATLGLAVNNTAGSAIMGKVGIDQTTDGTTNKVAADLRLAGVAVDKGAGTGGSATLRFIPDSAYFSALGQTTMSASAPVVIASDQSSIPVIQKPTATANGQTSSRVNAAASTNATNLKASAGQIGEIDLKNVAAYTVFLKFYNKASAPTVGTDTPIWTIPISAGEGYARSFPRGKTFATGIAYAITKLQADSDTTVLVAGDLTGSIDWI